MWENKQSANTAHMSNEKVRDAVVSEDRLRENTFKRCDLHVHSSSCYSRHYSEADFCKAILDSDLDVVAITDHNSVDVGLLDRLSKATRAKCKTLLAGVELNLKLKPETIRRRHLVISSKGVDNYFHALIWTSLSDAKELSHCIDELFLEAGIVDASAVEQVKSGKMTRSDYSLLTEGKAVYLEEMQEKLSHISHFLVPHEYKGSRNLSDYLPPCDASGNFVHENDEYKDRLFYYSHGMAVEGGQKSRDRISLAMEKSLATTLSALFFSDAKKLEDIGKRFSWIDFDGDLDSLLLATSDPKSRIRISKDCPELPQHNTRNFLESLTFEVRDRDGNAHKRELRFAPGFNGIVGSRGSGKSMLAHILANKELGSYGSLINADSIRYTKIGGTPSSDPPMCLYLGQGELAGLFRKESYDSIPSLKQIIGPEREGAEKSSAEALNELKKIIDLQAQLLKAFAGRYSSGSVSIDYLDSTEPSGITIETPDSVPGSDKAKLDKLRECLSETDVKLEETKKSLSDAPTDPSFDEDKGLFKAVNSEVEHIRSSLNAASNRLRRLSELLNCDYAGWFDVRDTLMRKFTLLAAELNESDNSNERVDYIEREERAIVFFKDLMRLRLALRDLNCMADFWHKKALSPIEPISLEADGSAIRVFLGYRDEKSYGEHASASLKGTVDDCTEALAKVCLNCNETEKIKLLFNQTRYRNIEASADCYIDRYTSMLKSDIEEARQIETDIELDGISIDEMSPGMQAHALLKLFLNDKISRDYDCIILDQPEDNLDVRTIKEFLVDRIKELKTETQLFVVSHSAPVIVNGDARAVVVCDATGEAMEYCEGSINGESTKQEIATVLDGGELYLKMRFNKYNFKVGDSR